MTRISLPVLLVSALCCGCASNGFMMASPVVSLYGPAYSAKPADAHIDIYRIARPEKEFIEVGEISCRDTDDDWSLKQILIKAREIGADGIVILGAAGTTGMGVPVGDLVVASQQEIGLKAVAIRYR